jgi:hypothetical protein
MFRRIFLILALLATGFHAARADPILIAFTAMIGTSNDIDAGDVFGEGYGANLGKQMIVGSVTIDPASVTESCDVEGACHQDLGAGALIVSFTLNGMTSTTISSGVPNYSGPGAGGSVAISDPSNGGYNYLAVAASSPNGMLRQSIGVLFDLATRFSAYGNGEPATAIDSLSGIGDGSGLVNGGVTFLSPIEHLDATIVTINARAVAEPAGLALLVVGLAGARMVRRKRAN